MPFGARFRVLRKRAKLTQEGAAARLGYKRPAPVSLIERHNRKVPKIKTILKYAHALGCLPSEFMEDVETEYDRLRSGAYDHLGQSAKKDIPSGEQPAPTATQRRRKTG